MVPNWEPFRGTDLVEKAKGSELGVFIYVDLVPRQILRVRRRPGNLK